jgi:hypothetical protein
MRLWFTHLLIKLVKKVARPAKAETAKLRQWINVKGKIESFIKSHLDRSMHSISRWSNAAPGQPVYNPFLAFQRPLLQGAAKSVHQIESDLKPLIQGDRLIFEFAIKFEDQWNQLNDAKQSKNPF